MVKTCSRRGEVLGDKCLRVGRKTATRSKIRCSLIGNSIPDPYVSSNRLENASKTSRKRLENVSKTPRKRLVSRKRLVNASKTSRNRQISRRRRIK
ncbi:hypothetical protein PM082_003182 [Marasmius tenuissimus]|nr:hypothetical protein PM082_003182 [Marasmius tenuissimus]